MKPRRATLIALATLLAGTSCGADDDPATTTTSGATGEAYGAQVASYDLAAGSPQRFLVGLLAPDQGLIVGGEVSLDFRHLGTDASETADGEEDGELKVSDVPAAFTTVADGVAPPPGEGPRTREGEEGVGVYEARGVTFEDPGFWSVTVSGRVNDQPIEVTSAFEVAAEHRIVVAGDPAPRTANLLPGDPEAPPTAVDSRAGEDGRVPDPELHELTVAEAIATGLPTLLVISTPVFCVSRFCGPLTDVVQDLAGQYEGRANFVHIEVWRDFEANSLNRGAAEWIYPEEGVDPSEPWLFLIDGTGTVVQRWDNVANAAALEEALNAELG